MDPYHWFDDYQTTGKYDIYDYDGNLIASQLSQIDASDKATGDMIVVDSNGYDVSGAFTVSLKHKTYKPDGVLEHEKFDPREKQYEVKDEFT